MKLILGLFVAISVLSLLNAYLHSADFVIAMATIVNNYMVPNNLPFIIISACADIKCKELSFKICEHLHQINSKLSFSVEIFKINKYENSTIALKESVIFILDEFEDLFALNQRIKMTFIDFTKIHHFVIFHNMKRQSLDSFEITENYQFYVNIMNYQSFLFRDDIDLNLKLMSVKRFPSSNDCSPKLVIVNEFSTRNKTWIFEQFGLIQTKNFHNCRLGISYPDAKKNESEYSDAAFIISHEENSTKVAGTIPKIFSHLESIYNFKTDYQHSQQGKLLSVDSKSNLIMFCPSVLPVLLQTNSLHSIFVIPFKQKDCTFLLHMVN